MKKSVTVVPKATGNPVMAVGYTTADWNGHVLYQCKYCPVDILDDENTMKSHVRGSHPHSVEGQIEEIPVVLPAEGPVEKESVEEEEQCLEQL